MQGVFANCLTAFHIESLDQNDVVQGVTPPPGQYGSQYGSAAPSRPPSRTNNKHALDNMVSWTASEATGRIKVFARAVIWMLTVQNRRYHFSRPRRRNATRFA